MTYFENQKKRMISGGETIRDNRIITTERFISYSFEDSPSYEEVYINESLEPKGVRIVTDTKNPSIKYILMPPGDQLAAGDIIRRSDGVWLCTAIDPLAIYIKGFIEEANYELKWIDESGKVQICPTVFYFNTRSNFGVFDDRVMTMPNGRRQTILQKNEHTMKIRRGKRFIVGGEAFKVIDSDYVSDKGLVNLSFESDQIDPARDNIELDIADYYSNISDYTINILNGDFASIKVDQSLKINIEVRNKGKLVLNPVVKFHISDDSIAEIDSSGLLTPFKKGSIIVVAQFEQVTSQMLVSITDNTVNNFTVEIFGDNEIITERTKSYKCEFKNNGIDYPDESIFEITSVDNNQTKLAAIISQDSIKNTCEIKAGKTIGSFKLNVRNKNGLSIGSKIINIKPLY